MLRRRVEPFPWTSLDWLVAGVEERVLLARRFLSHALDERELGSALAEIVGLPIEVVVRSIDGREPNGPLQRFGFALPETRCHCVVGLEPALAAALLAGLLRRKLPLLDPEQALPAELAGALTAVGIEVARLAGSRGGKPALALRPGSAEPAPEAAIVHVSVIVAGRAYVAALWLAPPFKPPPTVPARELLHVLGDTEVALPLVVAVNLATPAELARLEVGAAWCPGEGFWIDREQNGKGALVAGTSERGLSVELGPNGRIVLRHAASVALAATEAMAMNSDEPSEPTTLAEAVLEAPLVVRVELGSVSLRAREWAALKSGDVVGTGRRIAEPVALRAGGRVLATGELVNIEGELGVRIREILPEEGA